MTDRAFCGCGLTEMETEIKELLEQNQVGQLYAAFQKGPRAGVQEQHHRKLSEIMSHLRALGHTITATQHTDPKKLPPGYARSVISTKSGKNKFKHVVRTNFNDEGGDHHVKVVSHPDIEEEKKDASASASESKSEE